MLLRAQRQILFHGRSDRGESVLPTAFVHGHGTQGHAEFRQAGTGRIEHKGDLLSHGADRDKQRPRIRLLPGRRIRRQQILHRPADLAPELGDQGPSARRSVHQPDGKCRSFLDDLAQQTRQLPGRLSDRQTASPT